MGLRGYEGTGVQGYMPHHRLRTLHHPGPDPLACSPQPKATPPTPPLLKRRVAQDKPLPLVFFGDRGCPRVGRGGWEDGGEQRASCYVGPLDSF